MGKGLHIYLYGWFGYRNLGDDLLLEVMLDRLSALESVAHIEVAMKDSGYLEAVLQHYPKVSTSAKSIRRLFTSSISNDVLVIGPGGLFPHTDPKKVAVFATITAIWKLLNRDIAYFLIGANAKQDFVSRMFWQFIEHMSALFVPRDSDLIEATNIVQSATTYPASDAVLSIEPGAFFEKHISDKAVAFCFANLFEEKNESYSSFVSSCTEIIESAACADNSVSLLSFTDGADEILNRDIAERADCSVKVLDYEQTLREIKSLHDYRLVVGMRFHACVLSILAQVAVVPISYSSKTDRLMRDCGMKEHLSYYCKDTAAYYGKTIPLDKEFIIRQVDSALRDPEKYTCPMSVVEGLRGKSLMAFDSLKKIMET